MGARQDGNVEPIQLVRDTMYCGGEKSRIRQHHFFERLRCWITLENCASVYMQCVTHPGQTVEKWRDHDRRVPSLHHLDGFDDQLFECFRIVANRTRIAAKIARELRKEKADTAHGEFRGECAQRSWSRIHLESVAHLLDQLRPSWCSA